MSWHVRVEPSGHEFLAEAHESLLDAALRAGLNLRYNCNNGTCGECQARLMSGTLGSVRAHDFRLGEAQKGLGRFLLCSASAASDLVIEVQELHAASDIPLQRIATRVAKVERLGNYAVLQLRTPRVQTLSFLAGQAADVMIDGHVRRLAIASCPCNGMVLQFHVRLEPHDAFSQRVFGLHAGDAVGVTGPYGEFQLHESARRPLLMVAERTGFAPIKSLIEHAVALDWPRPIRLVWCAEPGGHYLQNYCRSLEDAFDEFSFTLLATRPGDDGSRVVESFQAQRGSDIYAAVEPVFARALAAFADELDTRLFVYA